MREMNHSKECRTCKQWLNSNSNHCNREFGLVTHVPPPSAHTLKEKTSCASLPTLSNKVREVHKEAARSADKHTVTRRGGRGLLTAKTDRRSATTMTTLSSDSRAMSKMYHQADVRIRQATRGKLIQVRDWDSLAVIAE